jgi:hypothetical protein
MDVREIVKRKFDLADKLGRFIDSFERETGVEVTSLQLERPMLVQSLDGRSPSKVSAPVVHLTVEI